MDKTELWHRFNKYLCNNEEIGLSLDISRMKFGDDFFDIMEPAMQRAFSAMKSLEAGAISNPDEGRMVGHYWLRNADLAPSAEMRAEIETAVEQVIAFAEDVHAGRIRAANGEIFSNLLVIGIGGSALGPQFVADALSSPNERIKAYFLDNTDPDGMDRIFAELGTDLSRTLTIVISKSGSTKETRNGMLEAQAAYRHAGLDFARHSAAVTGDGSELDKLALAEGWLQRFPMWDWVGGDHPPVCHPAEPGRADGAHVAPCHQWPRRKGYGHAAVQGPPAALLPLSATADHGVDRQGVGPEWQGC